MACGPGAPCPTEHTCEASSGLCVKDETGRNTIFVADFEGRRIMSVRDMTGAGWMSFPAGAAGSAPNPAGIALDAGGRVYFTRFYDNSIARADDMMGANLVTFGTSGAGVGQFLDADGHIYIADSGNHRVVRIDDMSGAGWVSFGTEGNGTGQFFQPCDLALNAARRIYVADGCGDQADHRVIRVDNMNGDNWVEYTTYQPRFVAIGPSGKVYFGSASGDLHRMDDMQATNLVTMTRADTPAGREPLSVPEGMAIDAQERIYVTDQNRIIRMDDLTGKNWIQIESAGGAQFGNFDSPWGIAVR
jgi:outer membrane protein assembly factor BamB